jgi:hypothetical protein
MKKNLPLFILFSGMSFRLISQPTITSTGINPVIGESFTGYSATYINPGNSGASQTWDFSSMSVQSSLNSACVAPSSTANGSSFPNSNLCFSNSNSTFSYLKTTSTYWQNYGTVSSVVMAYSNPEDFMHYPFTYNDNFTDTWAASFISGGYTFYRSGSTTVTADGYGTLITPAGTYTNVLRVHFYQDYQDSTDLGGFPYLIYYQNDQYIWYKEGVHNSLATVYSLTSSSAGTFQGSSYNLNSPTGITTLNKIEETIQIFPDPAKDNLFLKFELNETKPVEITIFNYMGSKVKSSIVGKGINGENNYQLNIEDLSAGVYFAQINVNGQFQAIKRFIVSK